MDIKVDVDVDIKVDEDVEVEVDEGGAFVLGFVFGELVSLTDLRVQVVRTCVSCRCWPSRSCGT